MRRVGFVRLISGSQTWVVFAGVPRAAYALQGSHCLNNYAIHEKEQNEK